MAIRKKKPAKKRSAIKKSSSNSKQKKSVKTGTGKKASRAGTAKKNLSAKRNTYANAGATSSRNSRRNIASSSKAIFVTGVLGFIGSNIALKLAQSGPVIGLDRIDLSSLPPEHPLQKRYNQLKRTGVEYVKGELGDSSLPSRLERYLQECKAVIHTAAPVKEKGPLEEFRAVNVEATLDLARKSMESGVKKWIQFSSVMVYGFNYPSNVNETGPLRGDDNPYCITKIESEHALLALQGSSMDVVVLRPGDVYGPGSEPWVVRPLRMMKQKQFLLLDGGKYTINHVHIDHIVQAVVLSLKASGGQIFNVTDGISSSCREYFGALASMAGYPEPPSIPSSVAKAGAWLMEVGNSMLGREAQLNRQALRFVMRPYPVDSTRAMERLGYRPTVSLTQGLEEIRLWLHEERPELLGPQAR